MNKENVSSREYKIMLNASLFLGDQDLLLRSTILFWRDFKRLIKNAVFDTDGDLDSIEPIRKVGFYDTTSRSLNKNKYIFRLREHSDNHKQITLKYRHPDRFISQDRNMNSYKAELDEKKFEEDIKLPFKSLYSFSNTIDIQDDQKFHNIKNIEYLFPKVEKNIFENDDELILIGNFVARELVIKGADFQISEDPKMEAKCAIIVWYDEKGNHEEPVVAEFSFRYKDKKENFNVEMAQRSYETYMILQEKMIAWIDPEQITKTAYVFYKI